MEQLLRDKFPPNCVIALAVFDGDTLFFDVILTIQTHAIHGITTFDSLFHDTALIRSDEPRMQIAFQEKYPENSCYFSFTKEEFWALIEKFKVEASL